MVAWLTRIAFPEEGATVEKVTAVRTMKQEIEERRVEESGARMASQSGLFRMRATVSGMVQGVGFRYFTVIAAQRLNITGWVRNMRDGNVQLEAQGSQQALFAMYERLSVGPRWSRVEHVATECIPVRHGEHEFRVLRDE